MLRSMHIVRLAVLALAWLFNQSNALADRYSQLVIPFSSTRSYFHNFEPSSHSLVIEVKDTSANELRDIENYDETLIRRLLVKDLGSSGSEIHIIFRDDKVRASVTDFSEPFRIVVDMFDDGFKEERDPMTGLPTAEVALPETPASTAGQDDHHAGSHKLEHADGQHPSTRLTQDAHVEPSKYRLMQPTPPNSETPDALMQQAGKVEPGIGKGWRDYPIYVYRVETAPYESEPTRQSWIAERNAKGMTSAQAMADYGGKEFDYGNEGRALSAYQQVLHREPTVFERDVLHLWRLAETHLGQGNLTLAEGYYDSLAQKHPDSILSEFSKIRLADIRAIRAVRTQNAAEFPALLAALDRVALRNNAELGLQVQIRRAFWSEPSNSIFNVHSNKQQPKLAPTGESFVAQNLKHAESNRTSFLASSLLLHSNLQRVQEWQKSIGTFASDYFKRFHGSGTEPYRTMLKEELKAKLEKSFESRAQSGLYESVVSDYEALPEAIQAVRKNPSTAWALGQSYRNLGRSDQSVPFYEIATESTNSQLRIQALFWTSLTAGLAESDLNTANPKSAENYRRRKQRADEAMSTQWARLTSEDQAQIAVILREAAESSLSQAPLLKTPPKMLLSLYTKQLATPATATGTGKGSEAASTVSASAQSIALMMKLADRFSKLGLNEERRKATLLLKYLKPADMQADETLRNQWANQLIGLADEYRQANDYLEAGRLYAFTGTEAAAWDGRAEALFKGGLLLYRAGRRDEAMDAFKKASEDQGNKYYAEMAKERLDRLTQ
jgi:tetratricopeptide (TPR) repeat protein